VELFPGDGKGFGIAFLIVGHTELSFLCYSSPQRRRVRKGIFFCFPLSPAKNSGMKTKAESKKIQPK
jgi:hypothetical protein